MFPRGRTGLIKPRVSAAIVFSLFFIVARQKRAKKTKRSDGTKGMERETEREKRAREREREE